MKRQLQGLALILFGILIVVDHAELNYLIRDISIPFDLIGIAIGIAGLVLCFFKDKKDNTR